MKISLYNSLHNFIKNFKSLKFVCLCFLAGHFNSNLAEKSLIMHLTKHISFSSLAHSRPIVGWFGQLICGMRDAYVKTRHFVH